MSKIQSSNLFSRQIPEFIRTEYPLFVDFIKAYYEFLDQTQKQDLEKVRDLNTTLDEFIDRYKFEVANNIPLDQIDDPRDFLKRMKDFYLSRGSEASFKFLFRTIFGKEADLFYPSEQMLRVSDGRWKQDVAIFLEVDPTSQINPDTGDKDLFKMSESFVTIATKNKVLTTYVERVVFYSGSVYEVLIENKIAGDVEIGATVSFEVDGVTYIGKVLPCPSKVKIFQAGRGFKAGDIFFLRTQRGRGCEIKVTKVGTEGEIRSIQIMSFGLDYKTRFFSYLSSKYDIAFEFFHPVSLHSRAGDVIAQSPGYNDKLNGFIEEGYALKQTYVDYEDDYGAGSGSGKNLYTLQDYVGEPMAQFYSFQNNFEDEAPEDLAIIDIQLGAVAKYPGYYETQNGFLSDEMYLQDGNYYQSFSYVVRVEEQLDKYYDLVKTLLHPSGMKLFAEYNIARDLDVKFEALFFRRLLQLPLEGPDLFEASDDIAVPKNIGKNSFSQISFSQIEDRIKDVFKPRFSYISTESGIKKHVRKNRIESLIVGEVSIPVKNFIKRVHSAINTPFVVKKLVEKDRFSEFSTEDSRTKFVEKNIPNGTSSVEAAFSFGNKDIFKNKIQSSFESSSITTKFIEKPRVSIFEVLDSRTKFVEKNIPNGTSTFGISDFRHKDIFKNKIQSSFESSSITTKFIEKPRVSIFEILDVRKKSIEKNIPFENNEIEIGFSFGNKEITKNKVLSPINTIEDLNKDIVKPNLSSNVIKEDESFNSFNKIALSQIDSLVSILETKEFIKGLSDIINNDMSISNYDFTKSLIETHVASSSISKSLSKSTFEFLTAEDFSIIARAKIFFSDYSLEDESSYAGLKKLISFILTSSSKNKIINKSKSDQINNEDDGVLRLNPYDTGEYFVSITSYQPFTALT